MAKRSITIAMRAERVEAVVKLSRQFLAVRHRALRSRLEPLKKVARTPPQKSAVAHELVPRRRHDFRRCI